MSFLLLLPLSVCRVHISAAHILTLRVVVANLYYGQPILSEWRGHLD